MKTGLDSAFKQVMREYRPAFLFGADRQITECRYVAGNYAYICLTGKLGQSPQKTTGGALKSAAGKTQCVRKIATRRGFGFAVFRKYWLYAGKSERSSPKC
ncbi:hypothetical protein G6L89_006670 [Agrobacterium fabrum]|uniref:hypothetical protein n=1 Tax=Agrobacterium fabrum TaxID=1176649 RepID=UPI001FCEF056|nr:hypothetical protein [Agrobacterium fabrum]